MKNRKTVVYENAGKEFFVGFAAGLICLGSILTLMLLAYIVI